MRFIIFKIILLAFLSNSFLSGLDSSPLAIFSQSTKLKKELKYCQRERTEVIPDSIDILKEKTDRDAMNQKMQEYASRHFQSRVQQIRCIQNLELSPEETSDLLLAIQQSNLIEQEIHNLYRKWIYSLDSKNKFAPGDSRLVGDFLKERDYYYSLLYSKSVDLLLEPEVGFDEKEIELIYLSLYHTHLSFYQSISATLREEIFRILKP
ncbi:MAG: hypothetical protein H7A24_05075 [Leptospiraceae bacterium]|nr:hypothetical protein [Leptospiraceae bacterium]MCP5511229.1 hypothetical protein [Leptospiraceae bacterium]